MSDSDCRLLDNTAQERFPANNWCRRYTLVRRDGHVYFSFNDRSELNAQELEMVDAAIANPWRDT